MFLKNKNIIFKIRRSKATDYAALKVSHITYTVKFSHLPGFITFSQKGVRHVSLDQRCFDVESMLCVWYYSKIDKTKILMTNCSLMKVESIAECSPRSILQYV